MSTPRRELEPALAFLASVEERVSTRVESYRFGTAHFHDRLPRVWDRNFLRVECPAAGVSPLLDEAERLQGRAGLHHRSLHFDREEMADGHAPDLVDHGFTMRRLLVMAQLTPPARPPANRAVEVGHGDLRPARRAFLRTEPFGREAETVRQLLANDDLVAAAVGERCFGVREDGRVVSYCRLYGEGPTCQVEDVATLPTHRGRGHASAVVWAAVDAARATGSELVFLVADESEPAKEIYRRLGFEGVGTMVEAIRPVAA